MKINRIALYTLAGIIIIGLLFALNLINELNATLDSIIIK